MNQSKLVGLLLALLVGACIILLPAPAHLTEIAKAVLAVAAFTIMMWLFQVTNNAVASILMMGLITMVLSVGYWKLIGII
jgi:di/tricarboxylate transporter